MKAIAILDIDDELLEKYKDFSIDGEVVATKKEDNSWRDVIGVVGVKLIPFDKHTLKKGGKDYVIYERDYLLKNLDREYELNKSIKETRGKKQNDSSK